MIPYCEVQLEKLFPWINWRTPLVVYLTGDGISPFSLTARKSKEPPSGWACRFCVAMKGLKGTEVKNLPQSFKEFQEHMRTAHKLEATL